jgi:hypothetical protein
MPTDGSNRAERTRLLQRVADLERQSRVSASSATNKSTFNRDVSLTFFSLLLGYIGGLMQPDTPERALVIMLGMFGLALYPARHVGQWYAARHGWTRVRGLVTQSLCVLLAFAAVVAFGAWRLWPHITTVSPSVATFDAVPNSKVTFTFTNNSNATQYEASMKLTVRELDAKVEDFSFAVPLSSANPMTVQGHTIDNLLGAACRDPEKHLYFYFRQPELAPHQAKQLNVTHRAGTTVTLESETIFASPEPRSIAVNGNEIDTQNVDDLTKYGCFRGLTFDNPHRD